MVERSQQPEREEVLARLASAPGRLAEAARAVEAAEALTGIPPGEWTPREATGHLHRLDREVYSARLDALEGDVPPTWSWYEPQPEDDAPYMASTETALAEFTAGRAALLARLRGLDEPGWAKWGVHQTFGRLDVVGLLRVLADHDDEHIAALLARVRPGPAKA